MSFLDTIQPRGLLYQTAGPGIEDHLASPRVGYCGFDPTKDSLTIGNLVPIIMLMNWQRAGHTPIVVMGGGTGLIGDPSGKDDERPLMTRDQAIGVLSIYTHRQYEFSADEISLMATIGEQCALAIGFRIQCDN